MILDRHQLILGHDGKNKIIQEHTRRQREIELQRIHRPILQIYNLPAELDDILKQVMTRAERKHGMKRGDIASTSAKTEKVRVTVCSQSTILGFCLAELLAVKRKMDIEPARMWIFY